MLPEIHVTEEIRTNRQKTAFFCPERRYIKKKYDLSTWPFHSKVQ